MFESHYIVRPDISIMAAGAHLLDLGDMKATLAFLKSFIEEIHANLPKIEFLWKTQNPGHARCSLAHEPVNISQYPIPSAFDVYNWNQEVVFDDFSRNHSKLLGYNVIDMSPLYLRPDAHPGKLSNGLQDCLHYCLPGPLNLFAVALMQMLYNKEI